ncbi:sensor histidine kinase [Amycolatopsis sp. NPDC059027]|uniref:sensor histidine kinase n=1 Tax=unclassified Amycolatopsis TaxID=2618356 RepID=UPI00366E2BFB
MIRRRRWTLRTRLLLALLALTGIGLAAFGMLSVTLLDRSQLDRVDSQLAVMAENVASPDRPPPRPPVELNSAERLPTDFRVFFFQTAGELTDQVGVTSKITSAPELPPMDAASVRERAGTPVTVPDRGGTGEWRVRTVVQAPTPAEPRGGTAAVALSLDTVNATTAKLRTIELAAGSVLLVIIGLTATWLVRLGLRPLTRIEHTAKAIADGELDRRVAEDDRNTEVGRLGAAFNVMLTRISSALKQREQSEDRLRRFVGDASHELRTPLTSIRGFAELYRKGGAENEADVERLMGRIESEAIRMGQLVDDLLLLARLDQERSLDLTEIDLAVLAEDVVLDARARAPEREISLCRPEKPVRVIGDEHRVRQVMTNLVGNALVHTPATAGIHVSVGFEPANRRSRKPTAEAGGQPPRTSTLAVFEVRDEGQGIPPGDASRVFDRFYRVDRARSRGGTGLGLAITAAILEAHNGRVQVYTRQGKGTIFRVLLAPT